MHSFACVDLADSADKDKIPVELDPRCFEYNESMKYENLVIANALYEREEIRAFWLKGSLIDETVEYLYCDRELAVEVFAEERRKLEASGKALPF